MQRILVFVASAIVVLSIWIEAHLYMVHRLVLEPGLGALTGKAAIPVPALGTAALRSYPYARSVPGFPTTVRGGFWSAMFIEICTASNWPH
jgi:hypothetical protein